jgi:hypothetical protein
VELFFFADAIDPDPKTDTSTKGSSPYPEWLAAITTTHELVVDVDSNLLDLLLVDEDLQPMANTPYVVRISGSAPVVGHTDARGIATLPTPAICPDHVAVSWGGPGHDRGYEYHRSVFIDCADGSEDTQVRRKLHNLGYSPDLGFDAAVRGFQAERNVNCDPLPIGAPNDLLPPDTKAALDAAFAELSTKGGDG